MIKIAPSILSADFMRLKEEIKAAEDAGADMIHIDIMDGHFVPNITIGQFIVNAIKKVTRLPLDVHLMIEEPDRYLKEFIDSGADYLTVHVEASIHLHRTVCWIKEGGAKAGVSLNPATPIWALEHILEEADLVVLMSVNPGFGGQGFIPQCIEKIRGLKKIITEKALKTQIEVDGGITPENAKAVADAGADILVMGSAFFNSEDYKALISRLRKLLNG
ncbi:MAG: ribulose-phosphate 3-epimerase [Nitrospirae bacterium]|nr:ribulose-phosphate 3-epimerase [Nitrospirota bacterium]